jgi:hypothetical protein
MKKEYNFIEHRDIILDIVQNMMKEDAEHLYPYYSFYKEIFTEFTGQLLSIEGQLHEKEHVPIDVSCEFIQEYKKIMVSKEKTILDLLKNKNIIHEKEDV